MSTEADYPSVPPKCPRKEYSEDWFGRKLKDPYHWLRDARNPEVLSWVTEENHYTDQWFDKTELAAKIAELKEEQTEPIWQDIHPWRSGFIAVRMREGKPELYRLNHQLEALERLFPDGVDENYTIYMAIPCPVDEDYLLLMGLYDGDARGTSLVIDSLSGNILRKIEDVFFLTWSSIQPVVYVPETITDAETGQNRIRIKTCNVKTGEENILLEADGIIGDVKTSSDGRYVIFEIWKDYTVSNFYTYEESSGRLTDVTEGHAVQMKYADNIDNVHYFVCKEYAPTGEILAVTDGEHLRDAEQALASGSAILTEAFAIEGRLFVMMIDKVCARLAEIRSGSLKTIPLPSEMGTAEFAGRTESQVFLQFESFVEKPMILSFDGDELKISLKSGEDAPEEIVVEQKWAPSTVDGTLIPYFMVRRKDAEADTNHPTWIYAYGGYNCSMYPGSKEMIANMDIAKWVMKGGIYVLANIRGGGEFGAKWHEEGMGMKKKNCYYDFIGVTEQLISDKWTNPKRIVISGCSNGGLLMSALITIRPDLFGCVIDSVPHTDMIHFAEDDRGPMYITEYGNPRESRENFEYLLSYSPYHNVKETEYPAVYIQTGECDNNVPPYHGKKFAAKMQAMNQGTQPILLRVLEKGAHDRGSGDVYWQTIAEMQLFVEKAMKEDM